MLQGSDLDLTGPLPDDGTPQRLHPLTPIALGGKILGVVVVGLAFHVLGSLGGGSGSSSNSDSPEVAIYLLLAGAVVVFIGLITYLTTNYRLQNGELRVDSGFLTKKSKRVRLDRLQSVDVLSPFHARIFGLSELRVTTAGTESATIRLRFLGKAVAQDLRAELLGRSFGLGAGVTQAPERPLVVVPHSTLIWSILLELISWRLFLLLLGPALILVSALTEPQGNQGHKGAAGLGVGLFLVMFFAIASSIWRRISAMWSFTVAESPDGVRIRHGLLSTSAQTVPSERVQALRIRQPLFWRPFGWASIRVNVAGYAGARESHNTVLLPVAPLDFAEWLVGRVAGDVQLASVPLQPPPRRARFRAPFWWKAQLAGSNDEVFIARHGIWSKSMEIVPHARTQSVRLTAGPWERALGLASLHLDSTRGPVKVASRFRDGVEARQLLDLQAERARSARNTQAPVQPAPSPGS